MRSTVYSIQIPEGFVVIVKIVSNSLSGRGQAEGISGTLVLKQLMAHEQIRGGLLSISCLRRSEYKCSRGHN